MFQLILLLIWASPYQINAYTFEHNRGKCERITIPLCQDMLYNNTRMPNLMGHNDQSDAAIEVGLNNFSIENIF